MCARYEAFCIGVSMVAPDSSGNFFRILYSEFEQCQMFHNMKKQRAELMFSNLSNSQWMEQV